MNPQKADEAADRLYEQLRSPLLTDISLDFGKLPVTDVYPTRIADLFAGRPVVVTGRYTGHAEGTVRLHAKRAGQPYEREIQVSFPAESVNNAVLPNLWARAKISELMSKDWNGLQQRTISPALEKEITQIGLKYGLMTQFTSFVAVEERVTNVDGKPTQVQVPVELPEGVQYEDGWGGVHGMAMKARLNAPMAMQSVVVSNSTVAYTPPPPPAGISGGVPGGVGAGVGGGLGGGIYRSGARKAVPKAPPQRSDTYNLIATKARPEVLAAYDCWEKQRNEKHTAASSCSPADGILHIEIVFSGNIADVGQLLASAGFKADAAASGNHVTGSIAVGKLAELAAIKQIRLIALRR